MTTDSCPPRPPEGEIRARRSLGALLRRRRTEAARALVRSVETWDKFAAEVAADPEGFLRREMLALVDYLSIYLRTGDERYRHLYVGEKLKQVHDGRVGNAEQEALRREVPARDTANLVGALRPHAADAELALLERELRAIEGVVGASPARRSRILLIGDCLHLDVLAFLTVPCLEDGVAIEPTFITTKNPAELRAQVRAAAERKFDLVFYSPFSYEMSLDLARYTLPRHALEGGRAIRLTAEASLADVCATVDVLAEFYECPVVIHTTALVRRHDGSAREVAKNLLTRHARAAARSVVNKGLAAHVERRSRATLRHLHLLDETPLLARHGDLALGRKLYSAELQHPAALGMHLAPEYRDIIAARALLGGKKLVMCDLDNTLWKGLIGEGRVEHYEQRQRTLLRLKERGVVLAVNSKNDPAKVRWEGAALGPEDFVAMEVSWDPKVAGTRRIAGALNLKAKDFVFVDDRPDEREMVAGAFPGLVALDATDERTWRLLETWARFTVPEDDTDRTRFYKERAERQGFLDRQLAAEDPSALFAGLGLHVTIRAAGPADQRRVVELVNRTNQFNTCGSRITARELAEWERTGARRTLIASARDKFGDMGTVCVLMYEPLADRVRVPVFVLSCRVFGYGIETAVLNHVRAVASAASLPVEGLFVGTPHNDPCRETYPRHGFGRAGESWVLEAGAGPGRDPSWLTVEREDPVWEAAATAAATRAVRAVVIHPLTEAAPVAASA